MTEGRRVLHLVIGDREPPEPAGGGTVVRLEEGEPADPDRVLDLIREHDVVVTW
jgi:hypothetical protein